MAGDGQRCSFWNAWASPRGPALAKLVVSHHEILLSSEGWARLGVNWGCRKDVLRGGFCSTNAIISEHVSMTFPTLICKKQREYQTTCWARSSVGMRKRYTTFAGTWYQGTNGNSDKSSHLLPVSVSGTELSSLSHSILILIRSMPETGSLFTRPTSFPSWIHR